MLARRVILHAGSLSAGHAVPEVPRYRPEEEDMRVDHRLHSGFAVVLTNRLAIRNRAVRVGVCQAHLATSNKLPGVALSDKDRLGDNFFERATVVGQRPFGTEVRQPLHVYHSARLNTSIGENLGPGFHGGMKARPFE